MGAAGGEKWGRCGLQSHSWAGVCSLWPSSRVGSQCCSGSPCLRLPVLLAKLEDAAFKPRLLPPLGLLCWLFFFYGVGLFSNEGVGDFYFLY